MIEKIENNCSIVHSIVCLVASLPIYTELFCVGLHTFFSGLQTRMRYMSRGTRFGKEVQMTVSDTYLLYLVRDAVVKASQDL
jgi:hypothetical protein